MAVDIAGMALDFIAAYGLYAIFVLLVMDAALMLPVFPGELVLVMAVAAYATTPGSLVFLILITTVAGLLGSLILYGITRGGGRALVERFPKFFMMPRKRRERLERTFQRPIGQSLVFFLRLVPLTRVLVNIPAGLARMPVVRFLVLSALGLLGYHAAFLWFTYEVRRPGSTIATRKEELEAAYASPAMEFVEANVVITAAAALLVGAVLSVRASVAMWKEPDESAGSLIGWASTVVLFWGGLALAAATYLQPLSVVELAQLGGVDVAALARRWGMGTVELLFWTAGAMAGLGLVLRRLRGAAKARRRRHIAEQRALERLRADHAILAAVGGRPQDAGTTAEEAAAPPVPWAADPTAPAPDLEPTPAAPRPLAEAEATLGTRPDVQEPEASEEDAGELAPDAGGGWGAEEAQEAAAEAPDGPFAGGGDASADDAQGWSEDDMEGQEDAPRPVPAQAAADADVDEEGAQTTPQADGEETEPQVDAEETKPQADAEETDAER